MSRSIRPLAEQCALVTGGTSGIGRAAALDLVRRGVGRILLTGRDRLRGADSCGAIRAAGASAEFVAADLSQRRGVAEVIAAASARDAVDIVVNAAGLTTRASVADASPEVFDELFDVNVRAPFFVTQACVRAMQADRRGGAIVNVLSFAMFGGAPSIAVYAMSKAALAAYTRNAGFALRGDGIRVNGLNMGWTLTPGEDATMREAHGAPAQWEERFAGSLPLGRLLRPEEVGRAIGHLATEASAPMTGSIVDFDQSVYGLGDWPPAM